MKWIVSLFLLLVLLMIFWATILHAPKPQKPTTDLVFATPAPVGTLDPHNGINIADGYVQSALYEGLYTFDSTMTIIPMLAESLPVVGADGLTYTVALRHGIVFHDGSPFDAYAVQANFRRMLDTTHMARVYRHLKALQRVEVVDSHTVRFHLETVFTPFMHVLANTGLLMISPIALDNARAGSLSLQHHGVGTGAFMMDSFDNQRLRVIRNPHYRTPVPITSISFVPAPEESTRIAMVRSGDAHVAFSIPFVFIPELMNDKTLNVAHYPTLRTNYLAMNTQKKPFDSLLVRKAIAHAIDRNALNAVLYQGHGTILQSPLAPLVLFSHEQQTYPYDPAKALSLLEEAGYSNGFDTQIWGRNQLDIMNTMEFIKQQLAMVGIRVTIIPMESALLDYKLQTSVTSPLDSSVALYVSGWTPGTGEPNSILGYTLTTYSLPPLGFNVANYSNPLVDSLLLKALQTLSPTKRARLYDRAQAIIIHDAPWIPLVQASNYYIHAPFLNGISFSPVDFIRYDSLFIQEDGLP